jgi:hypothetical protein
MLLPRATEPIFVCAAAPSGKAAISNATTNVRVAAQEDRIKPVPTLEEK